MVHLWLLSRVFYNLIRAAFWRASNCTGVVFKSSWRRAVYWKACVQDSSELPTFFTFLKSRLLIGSITWYPVSLGRGSGCFELRLSLVCVLWWHTRCLANQPTNQESRAYSPWVTFVTCPALPACWTTTYSPQYHMHHVTLVHLPFRGPVPIYVEDNLN